VCETKPKVQTIMWCIEDEKTYSVQLSKRHLKDLELFREFKGKPDQENWVPE
jgi:hypothetical protein